MGLSLRFKGKEERKERKQYFRGAVMQPCKATRRG